MISVSYDANNRIVGASNGNLSTDFELDKTGRIIGVTQDFGAFQKSYEYEYYISGNKKSYLGPDGLNLSYAYHPNSQLASIQLPAVGSITFPNPEWNGPKKIIYPGGLEQVFRYEATGQIGSISIYDPAKNLVENQENYFDKIINITGKSVGANIFLYEYDTLNRLVETKKNGVVQDTSKYDAAGNRTLLKGLGDDWIFNNENQLISGDGIDYEYDILGNLIKKISNGVVTRYEYDVKNNLSAITDGDGVVIAKYGYGPFGKRVWKEINGEKSYFMYGEEGLIGEYSSDGTPVRIYGYDPSSSQKLSPLFLKEGDKFYYIFTDIFGSVSKIVDISGKVMWSASYSSFGDSTVEVNLIDNPIRFIGSYFDEESGLSFSETGLYYNPKTTRHIRASPYSLGNSGNRYAFGAPGVYSAAGKGPGTTPITTPKPGTKYGAPFPYPNTTTPTKGPPVKIPTGPLNPPKGERGPGDLPDPAPYRPVPGNFLPNPYDGIDDWNAIHPTCFYAFQKQLERNRKQIEQKANSFVPTCKNPILYFRYIVSWENTGNGVCYKASGVSFQNSPPTSFGGKRSYMVSGSITGSPPPKNCCSEEFSCCAK